MSSSPKSGTTTTVATQAPWNMSFQNTGNYLAGDFLTRNGYQGYQGPYVADLSPYTQQAIQLAANRGLNGSPVQTAANQNAIDTLNGNYLNVNTNPYLSSAVNDALGLAKSQVIGLYGGNAGNNINNSGFQEQLTRTLGNVAAPYYAQAYTNERGNQLHAAALAPNLAAQDLINVGLLQQAGSTQDAYQQALVNAQRQSFYEPYQNLAQYMAIINGQGTTTTAQNPYFTSPTANALGLATGALGLYKGLSPYLSPTADAGAADGAGSAGLSTAGSDAAAAFGDAGYAFSDRRLKREIRRVGTHRIGVGLYFFKYIWDDVERIGVMADEVLGVIPQAVKSIGGYLAVNYSML